PRRSRRRRRPRASRSDEKTGAVVSKCDGPAARRGTRPLAQVTLKIPVARAYTGDGGDRDDDHEVAFGRPSPDRDRGSGMVDLEIGLDALRFPIDRRVRVHQEEPRLPSEIGIGEPLAEVDAEGPFARPA